MDRRALGSVLFVVFIDLMGFAMILPLLPFYAQKFGASALEVGLLAAAFALTQAIAGPVLGGLSDRFGRKPALLGSQLVSILGLVWLANAETLFAVFAARLVGGIGAANLTVAQATVADGSRPDQRARAFGLIGVAFGLGLFAGPVISGALVGLDARYPIWLAAALSLVSLLSTAAFLPSRPIGRSSEGSSTPLRQLLATVEMRWSIAAFFAFAFAFSQLSQGLGLQLERSFHRRGAEFGAAQLGWLFAFCGVIGIVIQGWLIGKLVPRFGEAKLARTAFVFAAIGYVLLGWAGDWPHVIVGTLFFATGNSFLRPCLMSLVTRNVGPESQGRAIGLTSSIQSVCQIAAPIAGAALIELGWLNAWAVSLAVIVSIGAWLSNRLARA